MRTPFRKLSGTDANSEEEETMREIKAYIRTERVEEVVRGLHDAGVSHVELTHARSLGSGVDPQKRRMSLEAGEWYTENAKLEFVCNEPEVEKLLGIIATGARTGERGDGVVFVYPVERALKIRTGTEGPEAL